MGTNEKEDNEKEVGDGGRKCNHMGKQLKFGSTAKG